MGPVLMIVGLVLVGIVLLFLEAFVIPGFGLGGIFGLGAMVAAGVLSWTNFGPAVGLAVIAAAIVLSVVVLVKGMGSKLVKKRFVLTKSQERGTGAVEDGEGLMPGAQGVAVTDLRPAGTALFGEKRVDVVSDGDYILAQCKVVVTSVEGPAVVVEEMT